MSYIQEYARISKLHVSFARMADEMTANDDAILTHAYDYSMFRVGC